MEIDNSMPCPNCGTERSDRFCPSCGQNDRNYVQAFLPVMWEILRETFEVDSRLWRTLKGLLLQPGHLTIEFTHNRRASYVTPIRLYVFMSLVFFFLVSVQTDTTIPDRIDDDDSQDVATTVDEPRDTSEIRAALDEDHQEQFDRILAEPDNAPAKMGLLGLADGIGEDGEVSDNEVMVMEYALHALQNPQRFFDQVIDNLPIVMFVLLPVYTLLLVIFNITKRRYLAEHLVFAVHFHTFVFVVFIVLLLLPQPEDLAEGALRTTTDITRSGFSIALMVYGYVALKRFYRDGYFLTTVKYFVMSFIYLAMLIPAFLGLMVFTATTI